MTITEDRPAAVDDPAVDDVAGAVEDDGSQEYVTFEMQGELYALEMARVQEIIRMPELVRVPLGPPALEGLANLRGRVLPVVSLRRCCGLPVIEHDEATRVVVVEAGGVTLGFVVDRVAAVVAVEATDIENSASVQSTVRSELLSAVLRRANSPMTSVLDVEHLVATEFAAMTERAQARASSAAWAPTQQREDDESSDTLELVSFTVEGQEYALPIDRVQEIVQVPEHVTPVPNARERVLGVMDLRGGLLPIVSLRAVFGMPVPPLEPHNRIVVITLERDGRESLVGVVMDTVREVLRVPLKLVGPLPNVVTRGGTRSEVKSVCRLEDGRRLVSVLAADVLIDAEELEAVEAETGADLATRDEEDEMADDGRGDDELLVVFRLEGEEYCVAVDTVQEIIRVPDQLIRVPRTLDFVEGLVNLRGSVLPVVDLRTRLGIERVQRDERQRIVVLIISGVRTGFVVDSVAEVARVGTAELEPAPELSDAQAKVVSRVANLAREHRMLLVLEPDELLHAEQVARLIEEVPKAGAAA